mmetsp:Transcript_31956/g.65247  ORF Transcript_31956/g.65247 Transcript_31956/m.65247 type:complete len:237 (-) Transcript_31956:101-811(-)
MGAEVGEGTRRDVGGGGVPNEDGSGFGAADNVISGLAETRSYLKAGVDESLKLAHYAVVVHPVQPKARVVGRDQHHVLGPALGASRHGLALPGPSPMNSGALLGTQGLDGPPATSSSFGAIVVGAGRRRRCRATTTAATAFPPSFLLRSRQEAEARDLLSHLLLPLPIPRRDLRIVPQSLGQIKVNLPLEQSRHRHVPIRCEPCCCYHVRCLCPVPYPPLRYGPDAQFPIEPSAKE